jgi:hypothetical protein
MQGVHAGGINDFHVMAVKTGPTAKDIHRSSGIIGNDYPATRQAVKDGTFSDIGAAYQGDLDFRYLIMPAVPMPVLLILYVTTGNCCGVFGVTLL